MNNGSIDQIAIFDRVSIRAVLVADGQNPEAALAKAGIIDPIAIPVLMNEDSTPSGAILGDGITPNLTAILETEQQEHADPVSSTQARRDEPQPDSIQQAKMTTAMLPPAFGMQPLAPIRNQDG